jgi:hypothetical protein
MQGKCLKKQNQLRLRKGNLKLKKYKKCSLQMKAFIKAIFKMGILMRAFRKVIHKMIQLMSLQKKIFRHKQATFKRQVLTILISPLK